eukprot:gnl/MRDRNA2_/MRDRNA2_41676_c0_seq1.p1 gnl/MRDRNA2_/MRDRNA2_41676_c0~~gnl/MRDRNA2_/MRDRNA2_41676_c0_seq1.p1  ORF type:complete len:190 (+),score=12.06 gnl/MRDRNA2_/MRDRNA2_41676_c0_seq1:131-700(+)
MPWQSMNLHASTLACFRLILQEFKKLQGDEMYGPVWLNSLNVTEHESLAQKLFPVSPDAHVLCGPISGSYLAALEQLREKHRMSDRGAHVTLLSSPDDLRPFMRACMRTGEYFSNPVGADHYQPDDQVLTELHCLWSTLSWVMSQLLCTYSFTCIQHDHGAEDDLCNLPDNPDAPANFQVLLWERRHAY